MRGDERRHALAAHDRAHQAHDRAARRRVELAGRLVREQEYRAGWPARVRSRRAAARRRTARAAGGAARSPSPTSSSRMASPAPRARASRRPTSRSGTSTFSAADRIGHQPERLEDEADLVPAPEVDQLILAMPATDSPVDDDATDGRPVEPTDQREQCRLARSRSARGRRPADRGRPRRSTSRRAWTTSGPTAKSRLSLHVSTTDQPRSSAALAPSGLAIARRRGRGGRARSLARGRHRSVDVPARPRCGRARGRAAPARSSSSAST